MPKDYNTPQSMATLAIIGLGPGGLATALEAVHRGIPTVAFTNRKEYTRTQRIMISSKTKKFLQKYFDPKNREDINFWARQYDVKARTVQTKDLERYLYRKLQANPNVTIVNLDQSQQTQIKHENNNNFVKVSNSKQKYYFQHLLAADGAKHGTANSVIQNFNCEINYNIAEFQPSFKYHAAVQLKLKAGISLAKKEKPNIIKLMLGAMKMGWDHHAAPKFYSFKNIKANKISFVGEIPEAIYNETDPEKKQHALKQWAVLMIGSKYHITEGQLEFKISLKKPDKNKFNAVAFEVNAVVADKTVINLHDSPSKSVFAQIGDARRTPYYRYGQGVNDAILSGVYFVESIRNDNNFDIERFESAINIIDEKLMRLILERNLSYEIKGAYAQKKLRLALENLIYRLNWDKNLPLDAKEKYLTQLQMIKTDFSKLNDLYSLLESLENDLEQPTEVLKQDSLLKESLLAFYNALINILRMIVFITLKSNKESLKEQLNVINNNLVGYHTSQPDILKPK